MAKKKYLIGIFGWKTGENSYGCSLPYYEYFANFGYIRILTLTEPIDPKLDLIVVPGGADVNPARYNQMPHFFTSKPDPIKEYQDTIILPKYINMGTPVMGICRGIQSIGVLFGAKLIQHVTHETNDEKRYDLVHEIALAEGEFKKTFEQTTGYRGKIKVNSLHHQCVDTEDFPDCLEILGKYKSPHATWRPQTIEVIRHKTLPIYAVQYHPEEIGSEVLSDYIVNVLLQLSENRKKN